MMSAAIEQTVMVDIYAWWFRYSLFAIHETQKKKLSDSYRDNLVWKSILATDSRDKECMQ